MEDHFPNAVKPEKMDYFYESPGSPFDDIATIKREDVSDFIDAYNQSVYAPIINPAVTVRVSNIGRRSPDKVVGLGKSCVASTATTPSLHATLWNLPDPNSVELPSHPDYYAANNNNGIPVPISAGSVHSDHDDGYGNGFQSASETETNSSPASAGPFEAPNCFMSMICEPEPDVLRQTFTTAPADTDIRTTFLENPNSQMLPLGRQPTSTDQSEDLRLLADMFRRISGVFVTNPVTKTSDFISVDQRLLQREGETQTDVQRTEGGYSRSLDMTDCNVQTDHVAVVSLEPGWGVHLVIVQRVTEPAAAPTIVPLQIPGDITSGSQASIMAMATNCTGITQRSSPERHLTESKLEMQLDVERKARLEAEQQLAECKKECEMLKMMLKTREIHLQRVIQRDATLRAATLSLNREVRRSSTPLSSSTSSPSPVRQLKRSVLADSDNSENEERSEKVSHVDSSSVSGSSTNSERITKRARIFHAASNDNYKLESKTCGDPLLACGICKKSLPSPAALRHHNRRVHTPDAKLLYCQFCGVSKKRKDHLVLHEPKCHKNPKTAKAGTGVLVDGLIRGERDSSSASSG